MTAMSSLKSSVLASMTSESIPFRAFLLSRTRPSRTEAHPFGVNSTVWTSSRILMRFAGPGVSSGGTVSPNPISSTSLSIQVGSRFSNLPTPKIRYLRTCVL